MSKKTKILALMLSVILLGALPFVSVLAANGAAVLTPAYQNIDVGQVTTVTLGVENIESLYGYQAEIVFNPAVLEVIDADTSKPGIQLGLGSFLQPDFVQQNKRSVVHLFEHVHQSLDPSRKGAQVSPHVLLVTYFGKYACEHRPFAALSNRNVQSSLDHDSQKT